MMVQRNMRALFQEHSRQHQLIANHHFAFNRVVQLFVLDAAPWDVLGF